MAITAEQLIYQLVAEVGPFKSEMQGAAAVFNTVSAKIEQNFKKMDAEIERSSKRSSVSIKALIAAGTGLLGGREVIQYADAWKKAGNALVSANVPAERQAATMERLYQQSQTYSISLGAQAQLYGATSRAAKQLTNDQEDLFRFTEAVAAALKVDGKSAGEASGALTQLGQLLRGTNVQAEEFNSLIDGAPALLEAAAKGIDRFNGDVGALIKAAKTGGLTSKEFFAGVIAGSDELKKRVDASADTFEGAFTKIENALTRYIGQTDDTLSASDRVIAGLNAFADNFNEIVDVVLKVAAVISGALVGRAVGGLISSIPIAIATVRLLQLGLSGASAASQFFTSAATGSSTAANVMGAAFGSTAAGAAAAARGIGLASAAARVFKFQIAGLLLGPIGGIIAALAVTFIDFSGGVDEAGDSLVDINGLLDKTRRAADGAEGGVKDLNDALDKLTDGQRARALREINAQIEEIRGGGSFLSSLGNDLFFGDTRAGLSGIIEDVGRYRQRLGSLFDSAADAAAVDEISKIALGLQDGSIEAEEAKKRLDALAATDITSPVDAMIKRLEVMNAKLLDAANLMQRINRPTPDAGEIATPFEQNRLAQQPLRDFYRQRDLELAKDDFAKDVDKRTEEIVKAAKDVGQAISEGAARIRATEEIKREREQALIGGNSKDATDRYVNRVIAAESGGNTNAKNPNSTATGLGQFIESTWISLFQKYFPDRAAGMSRAAILALRTDADISKALIRAYADENAKVLQGAGVAVTEAALQLSHFLGAGDAAKVLSAAPGTPLAGLISPASIKANPTILGGGRTVDDAIRYAERRAGNTRIAAGDLTPQEKALKDATDKRIEMKKAVDDLFGSVEEETKQLILETALMNASTTERERATKQAEIMNALKREGITIDENGNGVNAEGVVIYENLRGKIEQLAAAFGVKAGAQEQARIAQDAIEESQQRSIDAMDDFRDNSRDVLGGFISDLRAGKTASEALAGALQKIADKILDTGLDTLLASVLGAPGTAGGGGVIGGILSLFGFADGGIARNGRPMALPRFAKGGISRSAAIFGEGAMAEAAVPLPDGRSIPVTLSGSMVPMSAPQLSAAGRDQRVAISVGVDVDDSGNLMPFVRNVSDDRIKAASGAIVQVAVSKSVSRTTASLGEINRANKALY
ncbi:tape measure protein [Jiella pelagia]|uniref:Tape measure protein n=1 Tax=Jiella pelagia TaxID=2986949 RepID=A0ABY7BWY3_9HYPH|nr:tape measure protein [Jiella pelagia]WAP67234.1 tape measure protein [Jiella pelagia]